MLERIEKALTAHRQAAESLTEGSQNYLYMASLLCYEAALRGNRLFIYGEEESYFVAMYMVYQLRRRHRDLKIAVLTDSEEDFDRFEAHAAPADLLLAVTKRQESPALDRLASLAWERDCKRVGLSALHNKSLMQKFDVNIVVHAGDTFRIDEMHLLTVNIIVDAIDTVLAQQR